MNEGREEEKERVNILGVNVDCVDFDETLARIQTWVEGKPVSSVDAPQHPRITNHDPRSTIHESRPTPYQICTINPEFIIDARRDLEFARVLKQADLCVPDGVGILWAARLFGVTLKERVTGSDGIYRISKRAAERGWRVFLLGAAPGVADEAACVLQKCYPKLTIAGTYSGSPQDDEWAKIQGHLMEAKPDVLFVAFGHPRQDLWIARHHEDLCTQVAIGVGGAFDFVVKVTPRAPQWMQRLGLEWLYRLIRQPSRLGRMMKIPLFMGLVLMEAFACRYQIIGK